jgi:acylphosphatase
MDIGRRAVLATITGRVQGVSFRVWTRIEARRLGLAGWVRNEDNGSVTALIVGPDETVAKMVTQLWKGPPGASVSNIMVQETTLGEEPDGFRITA